MIYNDAYAPLLGDRHPAALGAPASEVWSDIWDDIGGMTAEVFAGRATYSEDLPLVMSRHGFEEETYFTFSFSPILEPGGQVAGLVDTVVETTKRVLATRRLGVLQRLGSLPRSVHGSTPESVAAALRVLAEARSDCPFGLVYLTGDDGQDARLVAGQGIGIEGQLSTSVIPDQVREAIATGETVTVTGLAELLPGLSSAGASPIGEADVHTAVVLPLTLVGPEPAHRRPRARHQPAPAAGRRVPHLPHPGRRAGRGRRRRRAGGRGRAPPRRRAGRARPLPCAVLHRRRRHPAARRPRPDVAPGRLRRPLRAGHRERWRWAATGTTSSTCRTAATASSWATSSAVAWRRRRSWGSSAAPGGPCCWRATRRRTCSRRWTGSPRSSPGPPSAPSSVP